MNEQPATQPGLIVNVARRKSSPLYSSRNRPISKAVKSKFSDSAHWDALAAKYLPNHDLPAWGVPATPEALARWIERMNLPLAKFLRMGAYRDIRDAIDLSRSFPLRAWIGLALETRGAE